MKLIVGLGNPGKEYKDTRHNTGFMAVDCFAKKYGFSFKLETKLEGELAIGFIGSEKVILLKPSTYMNLSGNSISKVLNFYKIDIRDMLIIYDDLSLDVSKLRLREKGSAGGHNGIKSIISHIGDEFKRIRIGIAKKSDNVKDYVLGSFSKEERELIDISLNNTSDIIYSFVKNEGFDKLMNKYN